MLQKGINKEGQHNRKCRIKRKNCSRKCEFEEGEEWNMNLAYEKCGDYLIPNLIPDRSRTEN